MRLKRHSETEQMILYFSSIETEKPLHLWSEGAVSRKSIYLVAGRGAYARGVLYEQCSTKENGAQASSHRIHHQKSPFRANRIPDQQRVENSVCFAFLLASPPVRPAAARQNGLPQHRLFEGDGHATKRRSHTYDNGLTSSKTDCICYRKCEQVILYFQAYKTEKPPKLWTVAVVSRNCICLDAGRGDCARDVQRGQFSIKLNETQASSVQEPSEAPPDIRNVTYSDSAFGSPNTPYGIPLLQLHAGSRLIYGARTLHGEREVPYNKASVRASFKRRCNRDLGVRQLRIRPV